ncbi:MAG TPA: N-6 DNA methylase [Fimbriimonadaceae bacterium]
MPSPNLQTAFPFSEELSDIAASLVRGKNLTAALTVIAESIRAGADPLGDAFIAARSADDRRITGTVYTPGEIVSSMIAWAQQQGTPARVVDPGAGSGRFLLAAARVFPDAELIGVEIDPLAVDILRANLHVCGYSERARIIPEDYREADISPIDGPTLFLGNPPYVRHHDIEPKWKQWFADGAGDYGHLASKLAGLHIHFFIRTLQLAREGDYGAFITSAEWLDVNYGSVLRNLLAGELGGTSLHVLDPKAMPFPDVATTGAITCFKVRQRPKTFRLQAVESLADLNALSNGNSIPWSEAQLSPRWSTIVRPGPKPPSDHIELGELCRVHRGQVTGNNEIWIAGPHAKGLPEDLLLPTVTKARELIEAVDILQDPSPLRRVINLPANLDDIDAEFLPAVKRFVAWAKRQGADRSYTAQHRRAWWEVRLTEPAPIMCTYMARRAPAFVRNLCSARHINIAHGLYPREQLSEKTLDRLTDYLRHNVSTAGGRTYAGGLTKFEPRELERVHVPSLEFLEA